MNLNTPPVILSVVFATAMAVPHALAAQETNRPSPITKDFSAFRIISDRNIFDPNRRPRMTNTPQVSRPVDSFALTGTMSYDQGRFAVFDGSSSDYHKVLTANGRIDGYEIRNIGIGSVTLVSGTNEVTLRVGMQMRRSQDGKWAASEAGETSYAFNSGSGSPNANRSERHWERNSNRSSFRNADHSRPGDDHGGSQEGAPDMTGPAAVPPDMANLNPNDPVARLMLRRLQETGGAGPGAANADGGPPDNANDNSNPGAATNPPDGPPPTDNNNPNQ